jgi:nucleotide-binding universal stress UspA family protein
MPRVLVPLAVLEDEGLSLGLRDLLATVDVTVLGYHVLPEQTPPGQARLQYEERANRALEDVVDALGADGAADYRLVFTHDREKTIERVADEVGAEAYVVEGVAGTIDDLLVPLAGDVAVERVCSFVADLVAGRDVRVTLLLATDDGTAGRQLLDGAAAGLTDRGLSVRTELVVDEGPFDALVDLLPDHDAVVMGESAPSLRSMVLGEATERVAAESVGPVVVVRREDRPDPDADGAADR